jgi:glucokinase
MSNNVKSDVQTIEKTGKKYKKAQLIGGICLGLGFAFLYNDSHGWASILLLTGLGSYLYGRMGAWWHHD